MSLVKDLDNDVHLVYLSVVSQLLPHTAEDLGKRSLAQTLILKTQEFYCYVEKILWKGGGVLVSTLLSKRQFSDQNSLPIKLLQLDKQANMFCHLKMKTSHSHTVSTQAKRSWI